MKLYEITHEIEQLLDAHFDEEGEFIGDDEAFERFAEELDRLQLAHDVKVENRLSVGETWGYMAIVRVLRYCLYGAPYGRKPAYIKPEPMSNTVRFFNSLEDNK